MTEKCRAATELAKFVGRHVGAREGWRHARDHNPSTRVALAAECSRGRRTARRQPETLARRSGDYFSERVRARIDRAGAILCKGAGDSVGQRDRVADAEGGNFKLARVYPEGLSTTPR